MHARPSGAVLTPRARAGTSQCTSRGDDRQSVPALAQKQLTLLVSSLQRAFCCARAPAGLGAVRSDRCQLVSAWRCHAALARRPHICLMRSVQPAHRLLGHCLSWAGQRSGGERIAVQNVSAGHRQRSCLGARARAPTCDPQRAHRPHAIDLLRAAPRRARWPPWPPADSETGSRQRLGSHCYPHRAQTPQPAAALHSSGVGPPGRACGTTPPDPQSRQTPWRER
jgi:hypothetical protein